MMPALAPTHVLRVYIGHLVYLRGEMHEGDAPWHVERPIAKQPDTSRPNSLAAWWNQVLPKHAKRTGLATGLLIRVSTKAGVATSRRVLVVGMLHPGQFTRVPGHISCPEHSVPLCSDAEAVERVPACGCGILVAIIYWKSCTTCYFRRTRQQ